MSVPVLTYHANNVHGNTYSSNDHVALREDLIALGEAGIKVISLDTLWRWHQGDLPDDEVHRSVALTFDDGSDFDFHDIEHPGCGLQQGLFGILRTHRESTGHGVMASSFVIASPEARRTLDRLSLAGRNWWQDDWWRTANGSGFMNIECHSWDHAHPVLARVAARGGSGGDFRLVDGFEFCETQVRRAGEYIRKTAGRAPLYFAFPWGQFSDYIVAEYLPGHIEQHGYRAAFGTQPEAVSRRHDRWQLPRYVCGRDWTSSKKLLALVLD